MNKPQQLTNSNHSKVAQEHDQVPPLIIPESRGDLADQAQEQIDLDIREKLYQIRKKLNTQIEDDED